METVPPASPPEPPSQPSTGCKAKAEKKKSKKSKSEKKEKVDSTGSIHTYMVPSSKATKKSSARILDLRIVDNVLCSHHDGLVGGRLHFFVQGAAHRISIIDRSTGRPYA